MNIEEFVTNALVQIAQAVCNTNLKLGELEIDATANPAGVNHVSVQSITYNSIADTQIIEFDLAVTVENDTKTQGNAGVGLSVLKLGTEGSSASSKTNVSRVSFKIPLRLPLTARKENGKLPRN